MRETGYPWSTSTTTELWPLSFFFCCLKLLCKRSHHAKSDSQTDRQRHESQTVDHNYFGPALSASSSSLAFITNEICHDCHIETQYVSARVAMPTLVLPKQLTGSRYARFCEWASLAASSWLLRNAVPLSTLLVCNGRGLESGLIVSSDSQLRSSLIPGKQFENSFEAKRSTYPSLKAKAIIKSKSRHGNRAKGKTQFVEDDPIFGFF